MITIKNFTELNSDPRSSSISAADFGASKFCFNVDTVAKLVAVWSDETGGEELNFKNLYKSAWNKFTFDALLKAPSTDPHTRFAVPKPYLANPCVAYLHSFNSIS